MIVFFGVGAAVALAGAAVALACAARSARAKSPVVTFEATSFLLRSLASGAAAAALLGKIAPYVVGPSNNPATLESVNSMS